MGGTMQTLSRQRTRIFLVNLLYFAALLGIGVLIFLMNLGGAVYLLAAVCVVCYLVLLRPFSRRRCPKQNSPFSPAEEGCTPLGAAPSPRARLTAVLQRFGNGCDRCAGVT